MIRALSVQNVKCEGCASRLKKALLEEFGEVEVDLEVEPRRITLEIDEPQMEELTTRLRKLGYPLTTDELSPFQTVSTSAKSFVSCAIGKIDNSLGKK